MAKLKQKDRVTRIFRDDKVQKRNISKAVNGLAKELMRARKRRIKRVEKEK